MNGVGGLTQQGPRLGDYNRGLAADGGIEVTPDLVQAERELDVISASLFEWADTLNGHADRVFGARPPQGVEKTAGDPRGNGALADLRAQIARLAAARDIVVEAISRFSTLA